MVRLSQYDKFILGGNDQVNVIQRVSVSKTQRYSGRVPILYQTYEPFSLGVNELTSPHPRILVSRTAWRPAPHQVDDGSNGCAFAAGYISGNRSDFADQLPSLLTNSLNTEQKNPQD